MQSLPLFIAHFSVLKIAESWDPDKRSSSIPQLRGAKSFSFEELSRCTNNFSEVNYVGCGGYGKVTFMLFAWSRVIFICDNG